MPETEEIRLAFLDVAVFADGSIRGGILTTDVETKPYEFRVTSPVKPTQLQQILYGGSLRDHVYGEMICVPLIKATKEKLTVVLIKDNFLMTVRPLVSVPVILIQPNSGQVGSGIRPLSLTSHRNFPNELSSSQTLLSPITQKHDLLEPFDRLKLAFDEVRRAGLGEVMKNG